MKENLYKICALDELENEKPQSFFVEGQQVLLIKKNDNVKAIGAVCPHKGAPLEDGVITEGQIVCPWHHSIFNIDNGDALIPPALDRLPHYQTEIQDGIIYVKLPPQTENKALPQNAFENKTFIIIGSGAAGVTAAKTLRDYGFSGKLIIVTQSVKKPYDRTTLSKSYLSKRKELLDLSLLPDDFFNENTIFMDSTEVTAINAQENTIQTSNGSLSFDKLLIASGSRPKELRLEGNNLSNIARLRTLNDADEILKKIKAGESAVIIGAGLIALEAAERLNDQGISVTIAAPEEIPLARLFGEEVGMEFFRMHKNNGIQFKLGVTPEKYEEINSAASVLFSDGEKIKTDFIIEAVGAQPNTEFLDELTDKDGRVQVDDFLQASGNIYAAGDIVSFKYKRTGKRIVVEHWRTAQQHGKLAALNMLGFELRQDIIPFFWTNQAGFVLKSAGITENFDEVIIDGNIQDHNFIAFYIQDNMVTGTAGMGRDKDIIRAEVLLRKEQMPGIERIRDNAYSLKLN